MNYAPQLPIGVAILMALSAAFMWGSWSVSLKYLKDFPLDGFYIVQFITSIILVWTVGFIIDGRALIGNLEEVYNKDPSRIAVTLLCGILYVIGMRISLYTYKLIGLSLAQPIQSSVNILLGTLISGLIGGVPPGMTLGQILIASTLLVGAVIASLVAGYYRIQSQIAPGLQGSPRFSMKDMWKAVGLLVISSLFIPAYTFALAYGLRSITQPQGMAVLPFMAILVTGAFVGVLLGSGTVLTINKEWSTVIYASLSIHKFSILSGIFHYGGNIIHTFATTTLSAVISWPLGITSGLWTQVWGLSYGEFKGTPKRAYLALFSGIGLYLVGAYMIANLAF